MVLGVEKFSFRLMLCIVFCLGGCASAEKDAELLVVSNKIEQVSINMKQTISIEWPLATLMEFGRDIKYSDGTVVKEKGYRAWDLNQDGRPDVVQVLDENGKVKNTGIDLDFDGKPDRFK